MSSTGTTYTCQCRQGYSGSECQLCNLNKLKSNFFKFYFKTNVSFKVDPCFNNPCQNGATCQSSGNGYYCFCPNFYSGVNCEQCNFFN